MIESVQVDLMQTAALDEKKDIEKKESDK